MGSCIAVVVPALELGGGVPAVAEFLCRAIERSGRYEVQLVSLATSARDCNSLSLTRPKTWIKGVRLEPAIWRGRPVTRVGSFLSELEFQRYKKRSALTAVVESADLVQVVCGSPAWALSVCGLGKPVVIHCATRALVERRRRDSISKGLVASWRRLMTKRTDELERLALRSANAVLVMNPWMLEYVRGVTSGSNASVHFAPPGIDAACFHPVSRDLHNHQYVLCVGRLDDPRKNIMLLLEAFAGLSDVRKSRTRLVLAGLSGPGEAFWARAAALNLTKHIEFVGMPTTEELVRLYQHASVFASSSDEEGFGVVLLEAMSCGLPVIATKSGGPESIVSDGLDGFLVERNDAPDMSTKLELLLSDQQLNQRMGEAARRTILQRYALEIVESSFLSVYDELLSRVRA